MNIISVSRGSLSGAKILSERLSEKLGIPLITREQIIEEADEKYNIKDSGIADISWVDRAPSLLERQSFKTKHYILSFQATLLEQALNGSLIYNGYFGQFMLKGIPFLLRVRFLRTEADRLKYLMEAEVVDEEQAKIHLQLIDERRRKWAELLYGVDIEHARYYDLVMNNENMSVDSAVNLISTALTFPDYNSTAETEIKLKNLYLTTKAKLLLYLSPLTRGYQVEVQASSVNGTIQIKSLEPYLEEEEEKFVSYAKYVLSRIDGVRVSFLKNSSYRL